jgi:uncharacterized protein (DUF983 family)
MNQFTEKFKQTFLTKNCPHCQQEMNFFLSKEIMKNSKVKTCSACNEDFKVDINYKVLAMTAIPIVIGVVVIGSFIFNPSQIVMYGGAIIGTALGFARASTLVKTI